MLFVFGELLIPPLELIPEHSLLSESEAKKVLKKFNVPAKKLPKIFESDPQAKLINAKPGDIIMIDRNDQMGKYAHYRLVVKG
jgi:DNA-directed RNA polymerase subunit H